MTQRPTNQSNLKNNQTGLVAIMVTVFFMIVLSLTLFAFSQSSRREQRQALDRQLSTQAFYAAESGINAKVEEIRQKSNDPTFPLKNDKCINTATGGANVLDGTDGVISYSCVLYDRAPTTLQFDKLGTDISRVESLQTMDSEMTSLTFEWNGSVSSSTNFAPCTSGGAHVYPPADTYNASCPAGMLRVLIMPVNTSILSRQDMMDKSFTLFLRPSNTPSVVNVGYAPRSSNPYQQGNMVPAQCDGATGKCSATITGLPLTDIFMSIRSVYKENDVTVKGVNGAGAAVRFTQSQIEIDATGKANDVLKRMKVRVPLFGKTVVPGYALESMDGICKQLSVLPNEVKENSCTN